MLVNLVDLLNSIDGIVWEAHPVDFRFTFVSAQAERIIGYASLRRATAPTMPSNTRCWCAMDT